MRRNHPKSCYQKQRNIRQEHGCFKERSSPKVLMLASVASMIDQFNMSNIMLLQDMGYEVHVACNFKHGNTCDGVQIKKMYETLQNMHVICHAWDCPRKLCRMKQCMNAYLQLWELTGANSFAWIHCHSPIGAALARIIAHRRKIRVIYTAHGFHFYKGAPLKNWLIYYPAEKLLSYWTDIIITVNREDQYFAMHNFHAGRICYIPGVGVDTRKYRKDWENAQNQADAFEKDQFHRKYRIPENAFVLLSVGELNKGKNHRVVMEALADLHRKDVYYLICGRGKLKKYLQCYADKLGVKDYIRMPGFQEDMAYIYCYADIFVLPSIREGMPVALMEAMAAGLPCVVSDVRGNRELIADAKEEYKKHKTDKNLYVRPGGIRVSAKSAASYAEALRILLNDACLRRKCGNYNKENIKQYDRSVVMPRMKKIYQEISNM